MRYSVKHAYTVISVYRCARTMLSFVIHVIKLAKKITTTTEKKERKKIPLKLKRKHKFAIIIYVSGKCYLLPFLWRYQPASYDYHTKKIVFTVITLIHLQSNCLIKPYIQYIQNDNSRLPPPLLRSYLFADCL